MIRLKRAPLLLLPLVTMALTPLGVRPASAQTINFNYSGGVVTYTIPTTGTYTLTAAGAQGVTT